MKKNSQLKLHISLSKEHNKYQSDVVDAFKGVDVSFDGGLMRFSSGELAMQIMLAIGTGVISSAMWDVIKAGIKKLYKKFNTSRITLRDSDSIMYTIKPDFSVTVLVVPDRAKEFEHIKTFDDLVIYFQNNSNPKNNTGWQLVPVSDVFTFVKSYAFSRDNLTNGVLTEEKIGNIHYGDIHATYTSENVDLSKIQIPIVKEASFNPKKEDLLKDGDLIMADASEDYDGIGVTISVHGIGKNKVVGGLHTFVLRDEKGKTSEYYRQYIFLNREIRNKLQKVANGVSVYGISKTALSKMELPLPSLSEQNRIVSVLETWDKSIEKLAQKIEAKKQVKKALIQDLLTGKKRLPGFNKNWEITELKKIAEIFSGGTPDTGNRDFWDGNINWITPTEITKTGKYIIQKTEKKITDLGLKNSSAKLLPKNSLIICTRATVGECAISTYPISTNQGFKNLVPKSNTNVEYLYYFIKSIKNRLIKLGSGSTFLEVSKGDIEKLKIHLPPVDEQVAIAQILATADKEITELEKKLSILKEQKRYLLNNLITGTIRTPETLSTKLTQ